MVLQFTILCRVGKIFIFWDTAPVRIFIASNATPSCRKSDLPRVDYLRLFHDLPHRPVPFMNFKSICFRQSSVECISTFKLLIFFKFFNLRTVLPSIFSVHVMEGLFMSFIFMTCPCYPVPLFYAELSDCTVRSILCYFIIFFLPVFLVFVPRSFKLSIFALLFFYSLTFYSFLSSSKVCCDQCSCL